MGNPTERRRTSTASFSPGHSGLQETSNHCAVIIQKISPAPGPRSQTRQSRFSVAWFSFYLASIEELPRAPVA